VIELGTAIATKTGTRIGIRTVIRIKIATATRTGTRIGIRTAIRIKIATATRTGTRIGIRTAIGIGIATATKTATRIAIRTAIGIGIATATKTATRIAIRTATRIATRIATKTATVAGTETAIDIATTGRSLFINLRPMATTVIVGVRTTRATKMVCTRAPTTLAEDRAMTPGVLTFSAEAPVATIHSLEVATFISRHTVTASWLAIRRATRIGSAILPEAISTDRTRNRVHAMGKAAALCGVVTRRSPDVTQRISDLVHTISFVGELVTIDFASNLSWTTRLDSSA